MIKVVLVALSSFSVAGSAELIVPKAKFMEAMKTSLPNAFCRDNQYFRKCFKVSEGECVKEALRSMKTCLISMESQIPTELKQPGDGRTWGAKLGECAGNGYDSSLTASKKKVDSKECKDPSKWK